MTTTDLSDGETSETPRYTAQVVLRPARSALLDHTGTSRARIFFQRAGFEVSEVLGNSFSILGDLSTFAETVGGEARELEPILRGDAGATELSLDRLPEDVRNEIEAVVITAKPSFGPWNP